MGIGVVLMNALLPMRDDDIRLHFPYDVRYLIFHFLIEWQLGILVSKEPDIRADDIGKPVSFVNLLLRVLLRRQTRVSLLPWR